MYFTSKDASGRESAVFHLLFRADQIAVVREADDMPDGMRVEIRKQVVVVALSIHDVDGPTWIADSLLGGDYSSRPTERLTLWVFAEMSPIPSTPGWLSPCPGLRREHAQRLPTGCNCQAYVEEEARPRACLESPQSVTLTREFHRRRVMQHENVVMLGASPRRHLGMRVQDSGKADLVVVDEPVERFQLSLGSHGLREPLRRVEGQPHADPLQPGAPSLVPQQRASKLAPDVREHGPDGSSFRRSNKENVLDP